MEAVMVRLFRIPDCKVCDNVEDRLTPFDPKVYDCSHSRNKRMMHSIKEFLGKWFKYPIIVIQSEDILTIIPGHYEGVINYIKDMIVDLRGG